MLQCNSALICNTFNVGHIGFPQIMVKAEERGSLGEYGVRCENIKWKDVCNSLRVVKVKDLNEDVLDLFKTVNNRDHKFCDTVTIQS